MKDFCKWLGVSDKIAKLVVWLFIGMGMLIIFNTALESFGLPFYKITADNLLKIDYGIIINVFLSSLVAVLNFYSVVLLVFRVSEFKRIFRYAILYLILNFIVVNLFSNIAIANIVLQIYIILYLLIFCYLYSGKNKKYIFYGFCSYLVNIFVQFICYLYKLRFINYENITQINRFLTSIDFIIIAFTIIFIKEIILKRKKEVKQ